MTKPKASKTVIALFACAVSISACVTREAIGPSSLKHWKSERVASTFPLGNTTLLDAERRLGACPSPSTTPSGPNRDGILESGSKDCEWSYRRDFEIGCGDMGFFGPCYLHRSPPSGNSVKMRFDTRTGLLIETEVTTLDPTTRLTTFRRNNARGSQTGQYRAW